MDYTAHLSNFECEAVVLIRQSKFQEKTSPKGTSFPFSAYYSVKIDYVPKVKPLSISVKVTSELLIFIALTTSSKYL